MGVSLAISIIKAKRVSTRWRKEERQEVIKGVMDENLFEEKSFLGGYLVERNKK